MWVVLLLSIISFILGDFIFLKGDSFILKQVLDIGLTFGKFIVLTKYGFVGVVIFFFTLKLIGAIIYYWRHIHKYTKESGDFVIKRFLTRFLSISYDFILLFFYLTINY